MNMTKINFNTPTQFVNNYEYQYVNLNFSRIIGGTTQFPNYTYIGINTPFVVTDPPQTDINGQTPFVNTNYQDNYGVTQLLIGDANSANNNPMIRIAFHITAPVGSKDTVNFSIIINDSLITTYSEKVLNNTDYVWEIGQGEVYPLSAGSYVSLLVSYTNASIQVFPYSLTMFYQQISAV